ncbi:SPX domain-containing protein [Trametes gibbosa]|uniref:SPX domain-containing protein n=1 Tax=Trametes gibbosa TaxID=160864 RepID=A0A6G6FSG8_9APHY|nr:SPX domain-containing protein [Trametes gibbosa]QIE48531.1 hypothetical protein [Trametes gibbosa]
MHFSKTYTQLLLTLPPELRESAIQYRQLKKLINQIVAELTALGLSPDVLHQVIQPPDVVGEKGKQRADLKPTYPLTGSCVIYELANVADHVEPRLRLRLDSSDDSPPPGVPGPSSPSTSEQLISLPIPQELILTALGSSLSQHRSSADLHDPPDRERAPPSHAGELPVELIIPLVSDTAFFRTLTEALEALASYLVAKQTEFEFTLRVLSQDISSAARPSSHSATFHPHSPYSSDPTNISVSSHALAITSRSDLDTWRQIFQLYMEADIFQGHQETFRGERDVDDAEARLTTFSSDLKDRISKGALKLRMKRSRVALTKFLELNMFILDLRKFQHVTTEATRKILKKHAKRTALPLAPALTSPFIVRSHNHDRPRNNDPSSLSLLLVQALTETLLPIIPHLDDYSCVICTSLAFKPIRLHCSHLFCVRCLVKLQKQGEQHCPICRAPTVLSADRSNVDWALLNFMKDWFPIEAKKKLQQNEREAAEEEMHELGLDVRGCTIM